MRFRFAALAIMVMAICALRVSAQDTPPPAQKEKPAAPASARTPPPIPVRVTVVLSRYVGEKKVSSMPYVLGVMATSGFGQGPRTRLRMGTDVPVTQTVFGVGAADAKSLPQTSYTYRNLGTSIDCTASYDQTNNDIFLLILTVADSSIGLDAGQKKAGASAIVPDVPSFRNFNSEFSAVLRDGQTMQYTSATDPVTGEVTKIDVTVSVMK